MGEVCVRIWVGQSSRQKHKGKPKWFHREADPVLIELGCSEAAPDEDRRVWRFHKTLRKQTEQMCDVGSRYSLSRFQMQHGRVTDVSRSNALTFSRNLIDILEDGSSNICEELFQPASLKELYHLFCE